MTDKRNKVIRLGQKARNLDVVTRTVPQSNEHRILGVKTAPKPSLSIHHTETGKPDMLQTTL
ncbi:hypothetical protein [uncultured Methanolobus sp.]|uniref:hypothetical protein n=1 Tax=uncultured Methanolobus sp. TaxID=218300 RepID=UPI0037484480